MWFVTCSGVWLCGVAHATVFYLRATSEMHLLTLDEYFFSSSQQSSSFPARFDAVHEKDEVNVESDGAR